MFGKDKKDKRFIIKEYQSLGFSALYVVVNTHTGVSYLKSNVGVAIHWVDNVTTIQKLNEYYIRTFWDNIIIASVIAIIPTLIIGSSHKKINNNLNILVIKKGPLFIFFNHQYKFYFKIKSKVMYHQLSWWLD